MILQKSHHSATSTFAERASVIYSWSLCSTSSFVISIPLTFDFVIELESGWPSKPKKYCQCEEVLIQKIVLVQFSYFLSRFESLSEWSTKNFSWKVRDQCWCKKSTMSKELWNKLSSLKLYHNINKNVNPIKSRATAQCENPLTRLKFRFTYFSLLRDEHKTIRSVEIFHS